MLIYYLALVIIMDSCYYVMHLYLSVVFTFICYDFLVTMEITYAPYPH